MSLDCVETPLPGVKIFTPRVFADARGFFQELLNAEKYRAHGVPGLAAQSNMSRSSRGTIRALHYQLRNPQAKLVMVLAGEILDVAVDVRRGSPSFGRWHAEILSSENHRQMYVPEGFAHGFQVLSDSADVLYFCSRPYTPGDEYGIIWDDPGIGLPWRTDAGPPLLSEKDTRNPTLASAPRDHLPVFAPGLP